MAGLQYAARSASLPDGTQRSSVAASGTSTPVTLRKHLLISGIANLSNATLRVSLPSRRAIAVLKNRVLVLVPLLDGSNSNSSGTNGERTPPLPAALPPGGSSSPLTSPMSVSLNGKVEGKSPVSASSVMGPPLMTGNTTLSPGTAIKKALNADVISLHPRCNRLAAATGNCLHVYDLDRKIRLASFTMESEVADFVSWVSDHMLLVAAGGSVWSAQVPDPDKLSDIPPAGPRLSHLFQLLEPKATIVRMDLDDPADASWILVVVASSPNAGEKGSVHQLYSIKQEGSQPIPGEVACLHRNSSGQLFLYLGHRANGQLTQVPIREDGSKPASSMARAVLQIPADDVMVHLRVLCEQAVAVFTKEGYVAVVDDSTVVHCAPTMPERSTPLLSVADTLDPITKQARALLVDSRGMIMSLEYSRSSGAPLQRLSPSAPLAATAEPIVRSVPPLTAAESPVSARDASDSLRNGSQPTTPGAESFSSSIVAKPPSPKDVGPTSPPAIPPIPQSAATFPVAIGRASQASEGAVSNATNVTGLLTPVASVDESTASADLKPSEVGSAAENAPPDEPVRPVTSEADLLARMLTNGDYDEAAFFATKMSSYSLAIVENALRPPSPPISPQPASQGGGKLQAPSKAGLYSFLNSLTVHRSLDPSEATVLTRVALELGKVEVLTQLLVDNKLAMSEALGDLLSFLDSLWKYALKAYQQSGAHAKAVRMLSNAARFDELLEYLRQVPEHTPSDMSTLSRILGADAQNRAALADSVEAAVTAAADGKDAASTIEAPRALEYALSLQQTTAGDVSFLAKAGEMLYERAGPVTALRYLSTVVKDVPAHAAVQTRIMGLLDNEEIMERIVTYSYYDRNVVLDHCVQKDLYQAALQAAGHSDMHYSEALRRIFFRLLERNSVIAWEEAMWQLDQRPRADFRSSSILGPRVEDVPYSVPPRTAASQVGEPTLSVLGLAATDHFSAMIRSIVPEEVLPAADKELWDALSAGRTIISSDAMDTKEKTPVATSTSSPVPQLNDVTIEGLKKMKDTLKSSDKEFGSKSCLATLAEALIRAERLDLVQYVLRAAIQTTAFGTSIALPTLLVQTTMLAGTDEDVATLLGDPELVMKVDAFSVSRSALLLGFPEQAYSVLIAHKAHEEAALVLVDELFDLERALMLAKTVDEASVWRVVGKAVADMLDSSPVLRQVLFTYAQHAGMPRPDEI